MQNLRKELNLLIKNSKGIALLAKNQKKLLIESLAKASQADLESLYIILLEEKKVMEKIEEDFQERSLKALQEYYATVKTALKKTQFNDLTLKNERSKREDLQIAEDILSNLKKL